MKKTILYFAVIVIVAIAIGFVSEFKPERAVAYHLTLADPKLYYNGTFNDTFKIQKGTYYFSFVPNGDSPQKLSITLKDTSFSFTEDFQLQSTPHNTGISTYYTWDYLGVKTIQIPEDQQLEITINPHGNLLGSVSVDLTKT